MNTHFVEYLGGLQMCVIDGDQGMSTIIQIFGIHEPHATRATLKLLKPGMTVIDAGSNLGYYAFIEAREVGETGMVYAMEPAPISYACLAKGMEANGFKNMDISPTAVGDYEGKAKMNIGKMTNSSNMLTLDDESLSVWAMDHLSSSMEEGTVLVPMTTLNKYIQDKGIKQIDFLRMDVEGYEINVMNCAWEAIDIMPKGSTVFMETHPIFYEDRDPYAHMYDEFAKRGFTPFTAEEDGSLVNEVSLDKLLQSGVLHVFWRN